MRAISKTIKRIWKDYCVEISIFFVTLVWGGVHAVYVYTLGLTTLFVDQNSHLNIARLVVDSLSPGISQLGFWPPLLHILLVPFVSITPLFESGLAGAFVLVPLLGLGAIFLYRILHIFTNSTLISLGGAVIFVTNPYILYYSVTPMTELLFITMLLGTAYYLLRWLQKQTFPSLIPLALFVALASIARFEGLLLIPIVGIIIIAKLLQRQKKYHEIEATSILFGLIASIGLFFIFIYGMVFGNGPFEFISGQWSAAAQQESFSLPAVGDLGLSILYMIEASKLMLGNAILWLAAISFVLLLLLLRRDARLFVFISLSAVLISPFLFDVFALFRGNAVLYVESLPPFDGYFNERYGLYWFGFVIMILMFFVGVVLERMRTSPRILRNVVSGLIVAILIVLNGQFLISNAYFGTFAILTSSDQGSLPGDQKDIAKELALAYDGGKILITRALQNYVTVEAGIPLRNYIHESNFEYYDQALIAPWFYARWVVMYNPSIPGVEEWRKENERISKTWGHSEVFLLAYELVYENDSERLYKLKDSVVKKVVEKYNLDAESVPSLNVELVRWNQGEFYDELQDGIRYYESTGSKNLAKE